MKTISQLAFRFGLALPLMLVLLSARAETEPFAESAPFLVNTSTSSLDSDSDGMPDDYEWAVGLDPFSDDASADPDGDGLTNLQEFNGGTSPFADDSPQPSVGVSAVFTASTRIIVTDSDGDGLLDDWELTHGLDPFRNDASEDPDGDGLTNLQEYNGGTNPQSNDSPTASVGVSGIFLVDTGARSFDSDGDGLPDWWEKLYFNDPRAADPLADTDGDGQSNYAEFIAGSNPRDANSTFRIAGLQAGLQAVRQTNGTTVTIRWASFEGSTYSIWSATLVQGPYTVFATNVVATPPLNTFSNTFAYPNLFFRVGVSR